jgi:hypothetical protein
MREQQDKEHSEVSQSAHLVVAGIALARGSLKEDRSMAE